MTDNNLISSEVLHLRVNVFCALFVALAASFEPISAFVLALIAQYMLTKM
jgi:hypothetical protein